MMDNVVFGVLAICEKCGKEHVIAFNPLENISSVCYECLDCFFVQTVEININREAMN